MLNALDGIFEKCDRRTGRGRRGGEGYGGVKSLFVEGVEMEGWWVKVRGASLEGGGEGEEEEEGVAKEDGGGMGMREEDVERCGGVARV